MSATTASSRVTIDDLRVSGSEVDPVVRRLTEHGVAVLPGWLDPTRTAALAAEFEASFAAAQSEPDELTDTGKDLSRHYGRTTTGTHLKYGNAELRAGLPVAHDVFNDPFMRSVTDAYLGRPSTLNRHVILTDDHLAGKEVISYHFDEIRSLKFLIYLDDVDAGNGAFEIIPGTQHQGAQIRVSEWLRTGDFNAVHIRVFEDFSDDLFYTLFGHFKPFLATHSVKVHAPAGSMIVFTTDTIHRAGRLDEGRRRRVARGSSYSGLWP
ncbi:phytanoyl-CoA dioxygenase family protein [Actinoplanes sp. L3-i22]|uniref:phytanoyl-CoA dioxygenase family protein n=1 Tax=Actinoplanes sp. L3-i22 TaxID=2836373 RepID=UPI001C760813|nr:phytanoyl-CoA dioxygenase family protein [Actinoplanes sp. L3-i22]BCY09082.1 hypothetical protein L3i22_041700 [Actinoplanes sp. L3-i22]